MFEFRNMLTWGVFGVLLLAGTCRAGTGTFLVVGVADGDTLSVLDEQKNTTKCRLYGIDAPEKAQAFGAQSKASLSELTFRKEVRVEVYGHDRYGRSICKISVGGVDVNLEQVARGMAWMYRRYTSDAAYASAEQSARQAGRGLWRDSGPVPPWNFRHQN